jgi:L-asparaginase
MELLKPNKIAPKIIIHGGAGNITRDNLSPEREAAHREALFGILRKANAKLVGGATSLDVATYAVSLLELDPLFNAGHGAVYTREGTHELEASVMVSRGYIKRGVGVTRVTKAKSPIKLAREMLVRGQLPDGGGAQGHCQLAGEMCDKLAEEWGLELVQPSYFWVRKRWDEHRRGLGLAHDDETYERKKREADKGQTSSAGTACAPVASDEGGMTVGDIHWDGKEYLPQGTVGAVALDSAGVVCVATSTGGITNKLPGRIGDTPTLGAGFFAEQWDAVKESLTMVSPSPLVQMSTMLNDCLPSFARYIGGSHPATSSKQQIGYRAVGMSGTGNGDSFLRVAAVRTAAAMARFATHPSLPFSGRAYGRSVTLQQAVTAIAGPHGELQRSAGDRWHKTGEGEGGIIGIELDSNGQGHVVFDHNCGGMFRAHIDDAGEEQFGVFHPKS